MTDNLVAIVKAQLARTKTFTPKEKAGILKAAQDWDDGGLGLLLPPGEASHQGDKPGAEDLLLRWVYDLATSLQEIERGMAECMKVIKRIDRHLNLLLPPGEASQLAEERPVRPPTRPQPPTLPAPPMPTRPPPKPKPPKPK